MRGSMAAYGSVRIPAGVLGDRHGSRGTELVLMAGQAQTVTAYTWTAPRTPWGDPDLQRQIRTTVGVHPDFRFRCGTVTHRISSRALIARVPTQEPRDGG